MAGSCYAIVEFLCSKSVAIVPVTWLSTEKNLCGWPPKNSKLHDKISSIVKNVTDPEDDWKNFKVRVLEKASMFINFY